jgi:hypothetical protein
MAATHELGGAVLSKQCRYAKGEIEPARVTTVSVLTPRAQPCDTPSVGSRAG